MKTVKNIMLILITLLLCSCGRAQSQAWSKLILGNRIPTPHDSMVEIISNTNENLSVVVSASPKEYAQYITNCKYAGFTIKAVTTPSTYEAYNGKGEKISLWYPDSNMHISLLKPQKAQLVY